MDKYKLIVIILNNKQIRVLKDISLRIQLLEISIHLESKSSLLFLQSVLKTYFFLIYLLIGKHFTHLGTY